MRASSHRGAGSGATMSLREDPAMANARNPGGPVGRTLGLLIPFLCVVLLGAVRAGAAPRVVVVGEVSGAAESAASLLRELGVADAAGHWSGGDALLVQTGDLLDRGENVRATLDLFMRLEQEAAAAGGRVVVLVGNHELLNMLGELDGVEYMAYQHFSGPGSELQQQRAWEAWSEWRGQRAEALGESFSADEALAAEWLAGHPPGWVEYAMSMRPEGVYGRWLRSLPAAFEHEGLLFAHAGFSPELQGQDVAAVNRRVAEEIAAFDELRLAEVVAAEIAYLNGLEGAHQRRFKARIDEAAALRPLAAMKSWLVFSDTGPLWFTGATAWDDNHQGAEMASVLDALGARRMIVGHASGPDKRIHARFGGRVIIASSPMSDDPWVSDTPAGLEIVDGEIFVVSAGRRELLVDGP
ncbi:MAG: metallophosphoesterase [Thermoanaerobaculales bacterium]|nr:metallophosphoesterase [Thermoanaerobaculales bacterium]